MLVGWMVTVWTIPRIMEEPSYWKAERQAAAAPHPGPTAQRFRSMDIMTTWPPVAVVRTPRQARSAGPPGVETLALSCAVVHSHALTSRHSGATKSRCPKVAAMALTAAASRTRHPPHGERLAHVCGLTDKAGEIALALTVSLACFENKPGDLALTEDQTRRAVQLSRF
jgi:hypothetical protein